MTRVSTNESLTVVDGAVASGGVRIICPVHSTLAIAGPHRVPVM